MWVLVAQKTGLKSSYLLTSYTYQIGRSTDLDIVLYGDKTISRLHAQLLIKPIQISETQLNDDSYENIILTDCSSSGTFVNNIKINGFVSLRENDTIRFGILETYFKLVKEPLIVTFGSVNDESKIKRLLAQICGRIRDEYTNDCNYVISDRLELTNKTMRALLDEKPLITSSFLETLVKSAESKMDPPVPTNFRPKTYDHQIESLYFTHNERRKSLLNGIIFVFETRFFMDHMKHVITKSGGQCELISHLDTRLDSHLVLKNEYDEEKLYKAIVKCEFNETEFRPLKTKIEIPDTLVDDTFVPETPEKEMSEPSMQIDETPPNIEPKSLFKNLTNVNNTQTPKRKYTQMDLFDEQDSPKVKDIKLEPKLREKKVNNSNQNGIIYSKIKPPPQEDLLISKIDDLTTTINSQLKIAIVPLKKKNKQEETTFLSTLNQSNSKKNFKKFRKIGKLCNSTMNSVTGNNNKNKHVYECKTFDKDDQSIHMSFLKFIKNTQ